MHNNHLEAEEAFNAFVNKQRINLKIGETSLMLRTIHLLRDLRKCFWRKQKD